MRSKIDYIMVPMAMGNWQNQLIMLKLHLFPRESGKDAALRPPKIALGLCPWAVLEALGRHLFQNPSKKGAVLTQNLLN